MTVLEICNATLSDSATIKKRSLSTISKLALAGVGDVISF